VVTTALTALLLAASSCSIVKPWNVYDFDGDGRADLVYVTSIGSGPPDNVTWFRIGLPGSIWTSAFGFPVPGDYDNNGRSEPADAEWVTGTWTTYGARGAISFPPPPSGRSSDGPTHTFPVPGRYGPDRATKPAWYDDSTGTWYIEGRDPIQFGIPDDGIGLVDQDFPVPGDYDGNGFDEPAVYRPATSTFYVMGGDPDGVQVGSVGQIPVPADYNGDRRTDPATFDGMTWHIAGQDARAFSAPTDGNGIPAPADHDGINGAEPAIWDQTSSSWLISSSPEAVTLPSQQAIPMTVHWNGVYVFLRFARLRQCLVDGFGCP
jgi:hypothetical protein